LPESRKESYPSFPPPLRVSYSIQIPKTIRLKLKARALSSPPLPSARAVYVRTRPQRGLAGVFPTSGLHLVQLVLSLRVVGIAQTAFSDWHPASEGLSGFYATEANMDQFVRSQNVERYRRLLERVTEQSADNR
jgi:hypothetical protein